MIDTLLLFRDSVLATTVIGVGCSVVGVYIVLRRVVFVGAALAQLSSAGIATAVFLASAGIGGGVLTNELSLALLFALAGVALFAVHGQGRVVPPDAVLGAVFVVAGAAAVLLVARSATADVFDLFFGGDVLLIGRRDLYWLAGVVGPVVIVHAVSYKEFLFVSYDPEMAAAVGFPVRGWTLLLHLTFVAVITAAMRSVGVLPVFSFLVLPGVAGLSLGRRMSHVFGWSVACSLLATLLGFTLSIRFDLPAGATLIVALGVLALLARLARSVWLEERGVDFARYDLRRG